MSEDILESPSQIKISVVVCTYNRASLLKSCLESLALQTLDQGLFEVLIIDNNSADVCLRIATEFVAANPHFRLIVEHVQGLSYARNRGYQEASGEYIAYIDDDAIAYNDWLAQMFSFLERHPDVEVFGGTYRAIFATIPPKWFPPEYGSLSLGDQERSIDIGKEFISGTNMVFRKSLLNALGGFNTVLGMKGQHVSYGEETRLQLDIAERQIKVYFLPDMKVSHLVAEYKMSLKWLLLSAYASGRCSRETLKLEHTFFSHLWGVSIGLAKMLVGMISPSKGPVKRRLYYALTGLCWELGGMADYLSTWRCRLNWRISG